MLILSISLNRNTTQRFFYEVQKNTSNMQTIMVKYHLKVRDWPLHVCAKNFLWKLKDLSFYKCSRRLAIQFTKQKGR